MKTSALGVPRHDSELARAVATFCRRGFAPPSPNVRAALPSAAVWQALAATGTALWLDTGDFDAIEKLWTREFTALTTNNTLLNKEVQKGLYDRIVPEARALLASCDPELTEQQVVLEIAFVLNAVHGLELVRRFDADVSVELHTDLALDTEASYRYGRRFAAINPERFIVKVPLTPEGVVAARRLGDDGIRVNFTLGFSARQNHLIARLARPTWVNVFMGRINAFVIDNELGDGAGVGEKATLASQRELRAIRSRGGPHVRQIGASIRNGRQVADLVGLDVLTIPTAAAEEYRDLDPPRSEMRNRTGNDPEVRFSSRVDRESLDVFWDVDQATRRATDELAAVPVTELSGERIRAALREQGVGGLFPVLDAEQQKRIAAEGKIPKFGSWQSMVASGAACWDGLLTAAALASFAVDQAKLDERIRKFL
jgi:transaldolase